MTVNEQAAASENGAESTVRVAVLDLGSSSFHLLVADAACDGSIHPVSRERVALALGHHLEGSGTIPSDRGTAALDAVHHLVDLAQRAGANRIEAVATSALRDAENGAALTAAIQADVGVPVTMLSGADEARLAFLGMRGSVVFPPAPAAAIDLGGGSLEIVVTHEAEIRAWSLALGANRLLAELVQEDPPVPTKRERAALRERVADEIRAHGVADGNLNRCAVATGGTVRALARLASELRGSVTSINQLRLKRRDLESLTDEILHSTMETRLGWSGVSTRRAELLPAGAVLLGAVVEELGVEEVTVSEWGLREGVVLDVMGLGGSDAPTARQLRDTSVLRLRERWNADDSHSDHVAELATELFDQTRALHQIKDEGRELLVHAALLHDIGAQIALEDHHRHGAYLVENGHLRGFTPREIAVIASLVRFHRGGGPKSSYAPFASLSRKLRDSSTVLTGILRVADGLERGHEQVVRSLRATDDGAVLAIHLDGPSPADIVRWGDDVKTSLLARSLDRRIDLLPGLSSTG